MNRLLLLSVIPRDVLFAAWSTVLGGSGRTRARNMMLALLYGRPEPPSRHIRLTEIGRLVGLDAAETESATRTSRSKKPLSWFWTILIGIGMGLFLAQAIAMVYAQMTGQYIPGTLYASISPSDHRHASHVA